MQTTKNHLIWFTNNLRTQDNAVLFEACKTQGKVIGVYCVNPEDFKPTSYGFKKTEKFRAKFLLESLQDLKQLLKQLNIELFVHVGAPKTIIPNYCKTYTISNVFLQKEWTKEETDRLNTVKSKATHVTFTEVYSQFLYHPDTINFEISKTPEVFTVFRKKLEKYINIVPEFNVTKRNTDNLLTNATKIPSIQHLGFSNFTTHPQSAFPFKGGETEALKRLQYYFFESKKLGVYKKTRNGLLGTDYSSKFSAWLANGCISAPSIYRFVKQFEAEHFKNQSTYWLIFELIWRDYFKYIALKHGNNIFKLGGILQHNYSWKRNTNTVNAWINGETASQFVNANMLELKHTGFMSNRGRQNVASYFAKELLLDWRIGAAYFESMLIDYDVHSNYGNWMYVSGVGNDPRNRKFNVQLQAQRYDANGKYQNTWLQPRLF